MCGIAGFFGSRDEALLKMMTGRIRHRGPDSDGHFCADEVCLGMRRLAIIDLQGGGQPIFNENGRIAVVYNGEIYNFQELREKLLAKGHVFKTKTDTEVLVHLYEEYGADLVKLLNGMFAFALWDGDKKSLLIARDHLGIKPLYYAQAGEKLYFASELKSLLCAPGISREISAEALDVYLSLGSIPAPHSIFRSIKKLGPGHWMTVDRGGVTIQRYWTLPEPDESFDVSGRFEHVEHLLHGAIRSQMVSDVPLGVFLSGGLDSSALVVYASRYSQGPLKTFSIGYNAPDQSYNELAKARLVADRYGCEHSEFILSPDIRNLLDPLVRGFDEPFADSSAVPNYLIARETRKHVAVTLTGVAGDEVFAGYPRYQGLLFSEHLRNIPAILRKPACFAARGLPDRGGSVNWPGRVKRFLLAADRPIQEQYGRWMSFISPEQKRGLLLQPLTEFALADYVPTWKTPEEKTASQTALSDFSFYLPSDLLCLADRMTMANSLEARVPFCDIPLVEYMARVPLSAKISGFKMKGILKKILAPHLPAVIISQTKKGFAIPLARWIREELIDVLEDCLGERQIKARGYFRPEVVNEMRRRHRLGLENHADALWGLLMLELWHREYADKP